MDFTTKEFGGMTVKQFGEMMSQCASFVSELTNAVSSGELSEEELDRSIVMVCLPRVLFDAAFSGFTTIMKQRANQLEKKVFGEKAGRGDEGESASFPVKPSSTRS